MTSIYHDSRAGCLRQGVKELTTPTYNVVFKTEAVELAVKMIKMEEGFMPNPYKDSNDTYKIGYGSPKRFNEKSIDRKEAEKRVKKRAEQIFDTIHKKLKLRTLYPEQYAALIDMIYNMGLYNFMYIDRQNGIETQFYKKVKIYNAYCASVSQNECFTRIKQDKTLTYEILGFNPKTRGLQNRRWRNILMFKGYKDHPGQGNIVKAVHTEDRWSYLNNFQKPKWADKEVAQYETKKL